MAEEPFGEGPPRNVGWCDHDPVSPGSDRCRYRLLIETATHVVQAGNLPDLFKHLAPRILSLTGCHFLNFSLHDVLQDCMIAHYWKKNEEIDEFDAFPVDECVSGRVWKKQEAVTIPDVQQETRFAVCLSALHKHGVRSYSMFPMSTASERFGAIGLGKNQPEVLPADDLDFLAHVARMVALAIQSQRRYRSGEKDEHLRSLAAIGQELNSNLEMDNLLPTIFTELRRITNCDYAIVALLEEDRKYLVRYAADWVPGLKSVHPEGCRRVLTAEATSETTIKNRTMIFWSAEDLESMATPLAKTMQAAGIQSVCNAPLISAGEVLGALNLGSLRKDAFQQEDAKYLQQVANQMAIVLRNAGIYREMKQLKDRVAHEKRYLENELRNESREGDIVGNSPLLKRVLDQSAIVAATDSTVLITGETGTGKERVARVIHGLSERRDRSFIKLNCAAIPTGLLESELFGHEKGAFTGAISQKVGRLELADKGTLFLDEIGEVPLELQPKLLRVLQDQEFERLGSTRTIRVDVRILAATNRDLARAVEDKEFRSDLFYRLHVFPLHLPALRDRREDIPLLVRHFVEKFSARLNRRIEIVPDEAIEAMLKWTWPGNIRELENFIERSVILSGDRVLRPPLSELRYEAARLTTNAGSTLREKEREHIVEALRHTRGVLSGPTGAASRLGLKRTTLQYKMQKLGISRAEYLD